MAETPCRGLDKPVARFDRAVTHAIAQSYLGKNMRAVFFRKRQRYPSAEMVFMLGITSFNWPIDGSIVGLYLLVTMIAGLAMRRYVERVDDFLVAGREMDVFLGIASLAATEFGI